MNKELIELQLGVRATCVVILDGDYDKLGQTVFMPANMSDANLYGSPLENPLFKEQIEKVSHNGKIIYFVIRGMDAIPIDMQNRYIELIKNREFHGYVLPSNVIIVLTVHKKEDLKKISKDLYHFCVVAF